MKKLLISMKVVENPNYVEVSNIIAFDYIEFFEKLGYLVVPVVNNSNFIENYFDLCDFDGVVLIGGNNVDPNLYNGENNLSDVYPVRDRAESRLIKESIKRNIPIVGICRGFHMLNVYFDGTLSHGIKDHVRKDHKLISVNKHLDGEITNTYHNQGVTKDNLSDKLVSIASTADGYIEAFKHNDLPILGVQWHPERQDKEFDVKLIKDFFEGKI